MQSLSHGAQARLRSLLQRAPRSSATGGGVTRSASSSSAFSATAPPSSLTPAMLRMRRNVLLGAAGFAMLTAAPLFYYVGELAGRPVPRHAAGLRGPGGVGGSSWVGVTPDGRWATLKLNAYGMGAYDEEGGVSLRGAVSFAPDGSGLTIEPVVRLLGKPRTMTVEAWPAAPGEGDGEGEGEGEGAAGLQGGEPLLVADGISFVRA